MIHAAVNFNDLATLTNVITFQTWLIACPVGIFFGAMIGALVGFSAGRKHPVSHASPSQP